MFAANGMLCDRVDHLRVSKAKFALQTRGGDYSANSSIELFAELLMALDRFKNHGKAIYFYSYTFQGLIRSNSPISAFPRFHNGRS